MIWSWNIAERDSIKFKLSIMWEINFIYVCRKKVGVCVWMCVCVCVCVGGGGGGG